MPERMPSGKRKAAACRKFAFGVRRFTQLQDIFRRSAFKTSPRANFNLEPSKDPSANVISLRIVGTYRSSWPHDVLCPAGLARSK